MTPVLRVWLIVALCFSTVWGQQGPRLVGYVQAPDHSLGVWVGGDRFGIEGQWDYHVDPTGQDWCWTGRDGKSFAPLPSPCLIEHVDAPTLTALIKDSSGRWFHWKPTQDGTYQTFPTSKKRYHGSEVFRPRSVKLVSRHRQFRLQDDEIRAIDSRTGRLLMRVKLEGSTTLALQPSLLAVSAPTAVHLLSTGTLKTVHKVPVADVSDLAFDATGRRLAMLTFNRQIRIYEMNPRIRSAHPLLQKLWSGLPNLTPTAYRSLVSQWEQDTGQCWWDL